MRRLIDIAQVIVSVLFRGRRPPKVFSPSGSFDKKRRLK